jgi:tetratricopeptide (TPR) repeat protein
MHRIASIFQLTGLTAAIFVSLALRVSAADVKTDSTNPYAKYIIKEATGSNAGLVLSAKGQQRLEPYDLAIAGNPKSASAYVNRAHMYESMQYLGTTRADWQSKAIEDYNSAIKFDPKNVAAYLARAKFFDESKQDQKALEDYSSVIGIAPDAETYDKRGWIYYHNLKQPQKALLDFNASIVLDTCNSNVYSSRACAEKDLGLNEKAVKDFTLAIDSAPRSWADYMYRGELYQKLGQQAKANEDKRREDVLSRSREPVEFYTNAIAEDPSNIGAYYLLADQLMRAGQYPACARRSNTGP